MDVLKQHPLAGERQEYALLLLNAHQEFFHRLLPQGPFTHIVIKVENTLIFILQNFIKRFGAEKTACLRVILDRKLSEIICALYFSVGSHNVGLFDNRSKCQLILAPRAHNRKFPLLNMPRFQASPVIGKLYSCRISFKTLFFKAHTKRRGVYEPPDFAVIIALNLQSSPVNFPFADNQHQICLLKLHFWPNLTEVSFGKFLNLIFQV